MNLEQTPSPRAISLDELIALNDEIVALSRAGVPMEQGLVDIGEDLPGRLGKLATSVGYRLEAGESLPQALSSSQAALPPTYRAVIEAGLRCGRLPAALEGVSQAARRISSLRKSFLLAAAYPVLVMTIAYILFIFSLINIVPVMNEAYQSLASARLTWLDGLQSLSQSAHLWGIWPLLLFYVTIGVWLYKSGRAEVYRGTMWMPSLARLRSVSRMAVFTELLALLVRNDVPLHESLVLAGEASGGKRMSHAMQELSAQIQRGETASRNRSSASALPPLLTWVVTYGATQRTLGDTLENLAAGYRQRADLMANSLAIYFPTVMTALVGGLVVMGYAGMILGPFFAILYRAFQLALVMSPLIAP